MSELPYAVILAPASDNHLHECGPARVMQILKITPTRAVGYILTTKGERAGRYDGYDVRPTLSDNPGGVKIGRIVARFASFDEAFQALGQMQDAWKAVESPEIEAADANRRRAIREFYDSEKVARQEMHEKLAPVLQAREAAKVAHERAINDLFSARLAAAKAITEAGREALRAEEGRE